MGKCVSYNNTIFIYLFACFSWCLYIIMTYLNKHIKILAEELVKAVDNENNDYDATEKVHDILLNKMINTVLRLSVIKYFIRSKFKR